MFGVTLKADCLHAPGRVKLIFYNQHVTILGVNIIIAIFSPNYKLHIAF